MKTVFILGLIGTMVSVSNIHAQNKSGESESYVLIEQQIQKIDQLILEDKLANAISEILELQTMEKDMDNVQRRKTHDRLQQIFILLGMFDEAIEEVNALVKIIAIDNPSLAIHHYNTSLALIKFEAGDYEAAISHNLKVLEYSEKTGHLIGVLGALNNLGIRYQKLENWEASSSTLSL